MDSMNVGASAETIRTPSSSQPPGRYAHPTLTAPLTFYDRHLAEQHRLKRVEHLPQMVASFLQAEATMRGSLGECNTTLSWDEIRNSTRKVQGPLHDAYAVAMEYQAMEAKHAMTRASSLLLHSGSPAWFVSVSWEQLNRSQWSIVERNTAFIDDFGLRIKSLKELDTSILDKMDEESQAILYQMEHRFPALAFWEIFCLSLETETVLRDLDKVALAGHFDDDSCRIKGCISVPVTASFHLDAMTTAWGFPISSMSSSVAPTIRSCRNVKERSIIVDGAFKESRSPRRVQQLANQRMQTSTIVTPHYPININSWPSVVIPRRAPARSMTNLFLSRAWARAVEHDTTFMIFRCGENFERIAFRHRSSQILYISDLIDLSSCPSYRRLQTGLYLSIVHDAFDRVIQQKHTEESMSQRIHNNHRRKKSGRRYVTRLAATKGMKEAQECKVVKYHADDRSLVLLEMRYDVYNSPTPASFVRVGTKRKRSYGPREYLKLVLTSEIGSGAVGVVHDAQLEVQEIEGMRHEFSIYRHLTSRGIEEGIPLVFGLFEDAETDAMALVMSYVGRSLWDLRPDPNNIQVRVSTCVRDAYLRVMSNIHRAGVRHCDLRPENLMLVDDETVTIIDFDQATINPSTVAKKREIRLLRDLLEGGVLYDSKR